MAIPTKREYLLALGWEFLNESRCRGCKELVEWWIAPSGKCMPMSVVEVRDETKPFPQPVLRYDRVSHFATCPEADHFRKAKA